MDYIKLEIFCCCCTVKTGSLVIGTLGWVFYLGQISRFILAHIQMERFASASIYSGFNPKMGNVMADGISIPTYAKIGIATGSAFVSMLLVFGVYKRNTGFILPWLVFKGVELGAVSIATACVLITYIFLGPGSEVLGILSIILVLITCVLVYFWLCVWSHYMEIGESTPAVPVPVYTAPINTGPTALDDSSVSSPKYANLCGSLSHYMEIGESIPAIPPAVNTAPTAPDESSASPPKYADVCGSAADEMNFNRV